MSGLSGIEALSAMGVLPVATEGAGAASAASGASLASNGASQADFPQLLSEGLARVEDKVREADVMVRRFTLEDDVPVHQVTIALEEARLAVELALQVRTRLVEGYREIMNMQL